MPQKQIGIELIFLNGEKGKAISTGNNAAWLCPCGYEYPLVGRTYSIKGASAKTYVECPKCGRKYYVYPEGKSYGRVDRVEEIVAKSGDINIAGK